MHLAKLPGVFFLGGLLPGVFLWEAFSGRDYLQEGLFPGGPEGLFTGELIYGRAYLQEGLKLTQ